MTATGVPRWLALALAPSSNLAALRRAVRRHRDRRLQKRDLRRLLDRDTHLLRDIGLSREDILNEIRDL